MLTKIEKVASQCLPASHGQRLMNHCSNDDFFGGVSGSQLTNKSIFCSGQQLLDCFVFNSICLPNNVKMYSWIEALNKNALCMDQ